MKVYADFREEVHIDPKDVIKKLKEKLTGYRGWILEKEGKYYRGWEETAMSRSWDEFEEITKEDYEYYQALCLVENRLKK